MSSSVFQKTYEKLCVDLYKKRDMIYKMKQELIYLQENLLAQNSTHSIQYIHDLDFKIAVICENLRKVFKQIKVIETSILMLKTRFFVANNFY